MLRIIIPTLNAAKDWPKFAHAVLAAAEPSKVLVLDSESIDGTQELARAAGFTVRTIRRKDFNHGGTRQLAVEIFPDAEILIYLTQDAVLLEPNSLTNLVRPFDDPRVGAVCGRQLPRPGAGEIEAHQREFNYPAQSHMRSLADCAHLGSHQTLTKMGVGHKDDHQCERKRTLSYVQTVGRRRIQIIKQHYYFCDGFVKSPRDDHESIIAALFRSP